MPESQPRDFIGYGPQPPDPRWPGGASIAVQFVLNYEEGGERSVLDGDATSETFLSEMVGAEAFPDRHMSMESLYEYGSRAGCWRVLRLFARKGLPLTVFGVARALERNPAFAEAVVAAGHEIVGHGYRWLSYQQVDEATEAAHLAGTPAGTRRRRGGWWWSTAGSSTTATPMPTIFRTGRRSPAATISSSPTPSTPMTCAS
jgi:peptidoglycan/xylan/chitin deacetylase (PgdA/CDA1 family)